MTIGGETYQENEIRQIEHINYSVGCGYILITVRLTNGQMACGDVSPEDLGTLIKTKL